MRPLRSLPRLSAVLVGLVVAVSAAQAQVAANPPLLLRSPSVSETTLAFRYADDIWTVARSGGAATRLTSTGNVEQGPYFSPDGREIAYTAHQENGYDAYVIPAAGGIPRRVTWHPSGSGVIGWTPDGKDLIIASGMTSPRHYDRLFKVHADGTGVPEQLPLPQATRGSLSPDGMSIAYEPISRWEPAWKRYYGGQNYPLWVVNLRSLELEKIPSKNTTDTNPIWVGHSIYFLSNRPAADTAGTEMYGARGPVSLFRYDTKAKTVSAVGHNAGLDLKSLQAGPGALVYEQFGSIHLVDLAGNGDEPGADHVVSITIHGDLANLAPHLASIAANEIQSATLSPTGARAAFEAHGDIFTVPGEKGDTRNLTNTPGVAEREPAWSPDGKTVAYFSDASGEYQLYLHDQTGFKAPVAIDLGPDPSYFYRLRWSPDSKHILYTDKHLHLWYLDVPSKDAAGKETSASKPILVETSHQGGFGEDGFRAEWSPDSKWITYTRELANNLKAVFLYSVEKHAATQVTDGLSDAASAVFDPNGKYLYFLASTDDGPSQAGIDMTSLDRAQSYGVYVAVLAKDGLSPVPPESDDEKIKDETKPDDKKDADKKSDDKNTDDKKDAAKVDDKSAAKDAKAEAGGNEKEKGAEKPVEVKVDLENIGDRILALPIPTRNYSGLAAPKAGVLFGYEDSPIGRSSNEGGGPGIRGVWRFTLEKRKSEEVLTDIDSIGFSADGSKLLIGQHGSWSIAATDDLKPGDGGTGKPLNLGGMTATLDPRAEWRQIFAETWRIQRDFLYDPNVHGLSIAKAEARYRPYLDGLASRSEFTYLTEEMTGEISIGHMFVRSPWHPDNGPKTGLLGADFTEENGRYRIAKILGGQNWTPGLASPLTLPGVQVKVGEYLQAVNGRELKAGENLYEAFAGTAGLQTVLHVGPNADGKDGRDVTVVPIDDEDGLRNLDWIEANRRKVWDISGGKVAYVYMPNTAGAGYTNFNRYFYSQLDKQALVLDERNNEGGFIADYVVDVLRRKPLSNAIERDGIPLHDPVGAIFGPKAMLINQNSGSGGDAMPWYFRKAELGKLVGTRTWGGLVGIGGFPRLIDGGGITAPRYAIYGLTGEWEVENRGIAPDIDVDITPKDFAAGRDPQLEAGVKDVLDSLKANPLPKYPLPKYPNYHEKGGLGKN